MKKFKERIGCIIDKNNLKKIFPVILLLLLTTLVIGITYAIYNASFTGNYNTITIGSISMSYTESTNVISIDNALPISDKEGKESSNYFDFSVSSNSNTVADIYYEINIEKLDVDTGYNALDNKDIKVYLENKDNNEVLVDPVLISDLSNSYLNENYWLLYANTHLHSENNTNITTNYRLRAWIDYNTDASLWSETNRYEYKFRVNINTNENNSVSGFASECFTYKLDNETMTATITDYLCGEDSIEQLSYTNKNYYVMPLGTTLENSTAITDFEVPDVLYASNDEYVYYIDPKNYEDEEMVNKCTTTILNSFGITEDSSLYEEYYSVYNPLCKGELLYGEITLDYFAIMAPEDIEELGLVKIGMAEKVGSISYKVVDNPTEEVINSCTVWWLDFVGTTEEDEDYEEAYSQFNTLCSGGEIEGDSLASILEAPEVNIIYGSRLAETGIVELEITPYKIGTLKPYSITQIGDKAFYGKGLTNITLSDGIISIGVGAFTDNKIPEENAYFYARTDSDSDGVAEIDYTTLVSYGGTGENVIIPDSVTKIGGRTFQSNNLTSITIPNSVTSIGQAVVNGNKLPDEEAYIYLRTDKNKDGVAEIDYSYIISYGGATSDITIPSEVNGVTVTGISYYAFQSSNLTSVFIPDTIETIRGDVFSYNSNLTSIVVDSNNTTYDSRNNSNAIIETSTNKLIQGCKNTIIPNDVTSIGMDAFNDMGVTTIEIPNSVVSIGSSAFYNNNLTSITIPNSVTTIGSFAFNGNSLTSLTLGNNVTTIGYSSFDDNQLTSLVIPDSVEVIESNAFSYNNLEYVVIGENSNLTEKTGIGKDAFYSAYSSGMIDSNKNLKTIYNNSGKSFDFSNAITGDEGTPFVTGTVSATNGLGTNVITITTGYPE